MAIGVVISYCGVWPCADHSIVGAFRPRRGSWILGVTTACGVAQHVFREDRGNRTRVFDMIFFLEIFPVL